MEEGRCSLDRTSQSVQGQRGHLTWKKSGREDPTSDIALVSCNTSQYICIFKHREMERGCNIVRKKKKSKGVIKGPDGRLYLAIFAILKVKMYRVSWN
ncbi:unnamed protein product [Arabis nemorensis]|uniref:Uncharacterized protein n=1 Tax=Arabis nemorensis TaxID=586526 RepID=A0A565C6U9_9BRAS|nr:unnamed protein product [Arabis nemorensis]